MKKFSYIFQFLLYKLYYIIFSIINIESASKISGRIISFLGPISKNNKYIRNNLKLVYKKNISESEIDDMEKKIWDNFGRYIGEYCHVFEMTIDDIKKRVELENFDYLKNDPSKYILVSAHMGNWDFALRIIKDIRSNIAVIYRHINNYYIDDHLKKLRNNVDINLIPKGNIGARSLLKAIKSNQDIIMLSDQKMKEGIKIPFMGIDAMCPVSASVIAKKYGYKIAVVNIERRDNVNFKLTLSDPITICDTDDYDADIKNITLEINNLISQNIFKNPTSWFWMHRKWGKMKEIENLIKNN